MRDCSALGSHTLGEVGGRGRPGPTHGSSRWGRLGGASRVSYLRPAEALFLAYPTPGCWEQVLLGGLARCPHPRALAGKSRPQWLPADPGPCLGPPASCGWSRSGDSRPRSHGRSHHSPGGANSGRGQLCSGAEAVISGQGIAAWSRPSSLAATSPGSSWLRAPRPCLSLPESGAVWSPKQGPRWAEVSAKEASPGTAGWPACPSQARPCPRNVPKPLATPRRNQARAMTWRPVRRVGSTGLKWRGPGPTSIQEHPWGLWPTKACGHTTTRWLARSPRGSMARPGRPPAGMVIGGADRVLFHSIMP